MDEKNHTQTFKGEEELFKKTAYLLKPESGNIMEIAQGLHTYNFEYHLPPNIPASAEGKHGRMENHSLHRGRKSRLTMVD